MIAVPLPRPFHVERTLSFLRTSALRTPYQFLDPYRVRRLVRLRGRPSIVEFAFTAPARSGAALNASPQLRVAVVRSARGARREPGRADGSIGPELRRLAAAVWSLDDDLRLCYRIFGRDPVMKPVLAHCRGLRMIRTPDLYEVLMIAIVNQQISVAAGEAIRRRLNAALGDRLTVEGLQYTATPTPRRLLAAGLVALRRLGLSRQKARFALEIAERARIGLLDADRFRALDDDAAMAELMEIPGVGRWTAEIAMMRGLGRPDVFPAGDLGLVVAVQRLLGRKDRPSEDELRGMAARWPGWRSYGAIYLWRSLGITA